MKIFIALLSLFSLFSLFSCEQKKEAESTSKSSKPQDAKSFFHQLLEAMEREPKKTPLKVPGQETILQGKETINGEQIQLCSGYNTGVFALNGNKDTVFKHLLEGDPEFLDFNQDGFKDIYIQYETNVPGVHDVALYDSGTKTFRLVEDLSAFPSSKKMNGTNYYFSYHRNGCADANWASDLFYIKNFKTHVIGTIEGFGCEETNENGIYVYRLKNKQQQLIRTFHIGIISNYKLNKWGFLDDYWSSNYSLFI